MTIPVPRSAAHPSALTTRGLTLDRLALAVLFILGVSVVARFVDAPVAAALQGSSVLVHLAGLALSAPGDSAPYLVAAIVALPLTLRAARRSRCARSRRRWQRRLRVLSFALLAVVGSGLLVNVVKYAVGRPRPWMSDASGPATMQPFRGSARFASFPSGHANTAAVVALLGVWLLPSAAPLFVLLAASVALGRVLLRQHYPSDVLVGAALGVATTVWLRAWFHSRGWWIMGAPRRRGG